MPLESARRASVTDGVLAQLEELVVSGEWPVGSRIPPEPELTGRLGVGRNAVREAVRALAHVGVLEVRQGDGTYVRSSAGIGTALERYVRRVDVRHVIHARRGLEREAARLAAARCDADGIAALDARVAEQHRAVDADDREAFVDGDVAFHRAVAVASGNPVLLELLDHLRPSLQDVVGVAVDDGGSYEVHEELVDAIRAGDAEAAERASDAMFDRILARLDEVGR